MDNVLGLAIHGGTTGLLIAALVVLVWAVRILTRYHSILKDYPPHLHVNGKVLYSPDFPPPPLERLAHGGD